MAAKKSKKSSKNHASGKGHVPLDILEERYKKLGRKIKARGGKLAS
jgi:hypothetical protein